MIENSSPYTAYMKLRNNIDKISETLAGKHSPYMQCRKGCDLCCMDYNILPVEFHFILEQLKKNNFQQYSQKHQENSDQCIFLDNNTCTIYKHRPVICRTHGLPLLYTNDNYEWELSTCELNFSKFNYENFTSENTFPQDKFNSRLFMLNKEFINTPRGKEYSEFDRIPIRKLVEQL